MITSSPRSSGSATRTTPLAPGLALRCHAGLTEAMGGQLIPEDTPGGGLTMVIQLLRARAPGEQIPVTEMATS